MRAPIIFIAVLGLAACNDRGEMDTDPRPEYTPWQQDSASDNTGPVDGHDPDVEGALPEPDPYGPAGEEGGPGGPGDAPGTTAGPGPDGTCGGDAEAFVRCVFAGLDSGAIDLTDPEDMQAVWGGTDEQMADFLQRPAEVRAMQARMQMTALCACNAPGPGAFGVADVAVEQAGADRAEAVVALSRGGSVVVDLRRVSGVWSFENVR